MQRNTNTRFIITGLDADGCLDYSTLAEEKKLAEDSKKKEILALGTMRQSMNIETREDDQNGNPLPRYK